MWAADKTSSMSTGLLAVLVVVGLLLVWTVVRLRGGQAGTDVIVRCGQGHLFTTIWLPGMSVKAIRLGTARSQWCPVGKHWTTVHRVPESELTEQDIQEAHAHHDIRVP
jgi:hypothetical protein